MVDCLCKIFTEFPNFDHHEGEKNIGFWIDFGVHQSNPHIKRAQQTRGVSWIASCSKLIRWCLMYVGICNNGNVHY